MKPILIAVGLAAALTACGERAQTGASKRNADTPAWSGARDAFVAPGWKPGDGASWEAGLQRRAQSQNEFVRIGAQR